MQSVDTCKNSNHLSQPFDGASEGCGRLGRSAGERGDLPGGGAIPGNEAGKVPSTPGNPNISVRANPDVRRETEGRHLRR